MGNLREVELPDGTFVEYLVDGEGRRVGKGVDGVLERGWLWRGPLQPVAELDASGAVVKRFVYAEGANVPELMVTSTATYRLVKDHLGSVRYVVDVASGTVVQELAYDAWGRVLVDTSPGLQPFGFAGGLYDPDTGLVRFGAREYWATIGRWTAKDPIRFDGGDTNLYAYVGSDPVNLSDPTGLLPAPGGDDDPFGGYPGPGPGGPAPGGGGEICGEKTTNQRLHYCLEVKTKPTAQREAFCKGIPYRKFGGKDLRRRCFEKIYESSNVWANWCHEDFGDND